MFLKIRSSLRREERGLKVKRKEDFQRGKKKKKTVSNVAFPRVDRNSNPKLNRLKAFLSGFDCPYFAKLCATFHRVGGKSSRIDRFHQS